MQPGDDKQARFSEKSKNIFFLSKKLMQAELQNKKYVKLFCKSNVMVCN